MQQLAGTDLIQDELEQVERGLRAYLKSDVPHIAEVGEYLFVSGGKRVRPALLLLAARAAAYRGLRHIPLACAVEYLHTATLLHDDVVDGAVVRRGRPSANAVWGNQASVLIGDFLLARSFSLLVEDHDLEILTVFCTATCHMAEGEVLQLLKTADPATTEEDYFQVVLLKTASLMSAACQAGGILGGLSVEAKAGLAEYGLHVGVAFQVVDDALDYAASPAFGKETGADLRGGKMTLPLIHLLARATPTEAREVAAIVEKGAVSHQDVARVTDLIARYAGVAYARRRAREHATLAQRALQHVPDSDAARVLHRLADYVVEREA